MAEQGSKQPLRSGSIPGPRFFNLQLQSGATQGVKGMFGEHFGENLRRIRKSRRMTQAALAAATGLHSEHISNLERGRYMPRLFTVQKAAEGLGVTVEALIKKTTPRGA